MLSEDFEKDMGLVLFMSVFWCQPEWLLFLEKKEVVVDDVKSPPGRFLGFAGP